jgi:hypothetical protein
MNHRRSRMSTSRFLSCRALGSSMSGSQCSTSR